MTALEYRCEVCKSKPGEPCRNTIEPGEPLPGREFHIARIVSPGFLVCGSEVATESEPHSYTLNVADPCVHCGKPASHPNHTESWT